MSIVSYRRQVSITCPAPVPSPKFDQSRDECCIEITVCDSFPIGGRVEL